MKVAYIAGKVRDKSIRGYYKNIETGSDVAFKYWKLGYAVISPHKNTAFFDEVSGDELWSSASDIWLKGDLAIIEKCDVIVMMQNYKDSQGALAELEYARKIGKEIIFD